MVRRVNRATRFRVRQLKRFGSERYGTMFGAALIITLAAIAVRAEQPGLHSVLKRRTVYLAQRPELQDIETPRSIPLRIIAVPEEHHLAQTSQQPRLNSPESIPSAPAAETVRQRHDPGIKPMSDIGIHISPPVQLDSSGQPLKMPEDFSRGISRDQPAFSRDLATNGPWFCDAAYGPPLNFGYRPLYFEEPNLERYGRSAGMVQPLVSAAHFYANVALLPYRLTTQRPGFCTYFDHQYRPGAPAPRERRQRSRLRLDGATVQAAAVMGLVFLIP